MALIQIRDVPEDVYETIRRRARRSGQSVQAFMLARTIEIGRRPAVVDVLAELEADLSRRPPLAVDADDVLIDRAPDRTS